ncbi:Predicted dehydrogenase [Faunimonas pinastri]|uniref:Predicted dehydrogenase n=1 Tax=Faunimonas pinastri TaxID=1855383 RepID=A0A1H9KXJ2_9HYPH|nr:Gfo/Idh/MocA family oxidoreductase [Faunimonas pinastri]SER03655.1 Predicted dehydrogenase [Faunimonas pinastri]
MAIEGRSETHEGRIRLGMVGGGQGAFIGAVHRIAARLDDRYTLVAGALSSDPERAKASGLELGLAENRCYGSYEEMARREARLKDGIEAVAIVTPNHMHFPVAQAFLKRGIHVICDKPLTTTLRDAKRLAALVEQSGKVFALTHNYTGYPMIRQARAMIADGELGELRLVQAEYVQDWLSQEVHNKQADWRTDPARSGAGGCVGDIGTHAYNLACFVTGMQAESLAADLTTFVEGRKLDDNVAVLLRYASGAKGMLWASQVAVGNENALTLRVYGTKGGLEWDQEHPNVLWFTPHGEPKRMITRNGAGAGPEAGRMSRIPSGHPEGYLEGFANIYSEAARAIVAARNNEAPDPDVIYPTVEDGVRGVAFIEACVRSSGRNAGWVKL